MLYHTWKLRDLTLFFLNSLLATVGNNWLFNHHHHRCNTIKLFAFYGTPSFHLITFYFDLMKSLLFKVERTEEMWFKRICFQVNYLLFKKNSRPILYRSQSKLTRNNQFCMCEASNSKKKWNDVLFCRCVYHRND